MPDQAAAPPSTLAVLIQFIIPFGMMFLIFYVLVFRPQSKSRKEHDQMLKNLKKHDEVVTNNWPAEDKTKNYPAELKYPRAAFLAREFSD